MIIVSFALLAYFIINKSVPIGHSLVIAIVVSYTIGIVINACDSHERLLLLVYPIFIIMLGAAFERASLFIIAKQR